jgi:hypothetical protein
MELPVRHATLHLSPAADPAFAASTRAFEASAGSAAELQTQLRHLYPDARVVESVVEDLRRWYVYRDGAWVP